MTHPNHPPAETEAKTSLKIYPGFLICKIGHNESAPANFGDYEVVDLLVVRYAVNPYRVISCSKDGRTNGE